MGDIEIRTDHVYDVEKRECYAINGAAPFGRCAKCESALSLVDEGHRSACPNGHTFSEIYNWPLTRVDATT